MYKSHHLVRPVGMGYQAYVKKGVCMCKTLKLALSLGAGSICVESVCFFALRKDG